MPCHLQPCERAECMGCQRLHRVTFFHDVFSCASRIGNPVMHRMTKM